MFYFILSLVLTLEWIGFQLCCMGIWSYQYLNDCNMLICWMTLKEKIGGTLLKKNVKQIFQSESMTSPLVSIKFTFGTKEANSWCDVIVTKWHQNVSFYFVWSLCFDFDLGMDRVPNLLYGMSSYQCPNDCNMLINMLNEFEGENWR